jgi:hypothetical protein
VRGDVVVNDDRRNPAATPVLRIDGEKQLYIGMLEKRIFAGIEKIPPLHPQRRHPIGIPAGINPPGNVDESLDPVLVTYFDNLDGHG